MRRANLTKIDQLILTDTSLFKPVTTIMVWSYQFNQSTSSQLPSSPRTPGWRRMTSEDIPSALALINKWSSQFEIGRVFSSEDFTHSFLLQKYMVTYVVEDKSNKIADLVHGSITSTIIVGNIAILISTQSPVKQLIIDALVCARENGAIAMTIYQRNIESDILASLSFQPSFNETRHFYNYSYHEISHSKFLI